MFSSIKFTAFGLFLVSIVAGQSAAYSQPTYLLDAAIISPDSCQGGNPYLGVVIYKDSDPAPRCATLCTNTPSCKFFNSYTLLKNNVFLESHCSLYSVTFDYTYATNKGQYDAQGNHYTISDSWTYSNKASPGVCNPAPTPTPTPSPANLNGGLACSQIQSSGYPCVCNQDSSGNLVAYASDNDCEGSPCKVNTDCSYGSICLPATRCLGTSRCAKSGATICTNFRSTRKMFKFKA